MAEIPSTQQTVQDWARFTLADWKKKLGKLNIGESGAGEASFASHVVTAADGDFNKVKFFFRHYLAYIDMGVGKGTRIGQVSENKTSRRLQGSQAGNRRRPKKWQNKVLAYSVMRLAEILQNQYGFKGALGITSALDSHVDLKL